VKGRGTKRKKEEGWSDIGKKVTAGTLEQGREGEGREVQRAEGK